MTILLFYYIFDEINVDMVSIGDSFKNINSMPLKKKLKNFSER